MTHSSWRDHFLDPQPGLTELELEGLETQLGFGIPPELRELYSQVSAGVFSRNLLVTTDGDEYDLFTLIPAHTSEGAPPELLETWEQLVVQKNLIASAHLPFANDAGGDIYTCDRDNGSIWYWPMDGDPEPRPIADSLSALLGMLQGGL